MVASVTDLFRHPVKGIGVEAISKTTLEPGGTLPWDRLWAIAHEAARIPAGAPEWIACQNFVTGTRSPSLMAVKVKVDEGSGTLSFSHPDRPDITLNPDNAADAALLIDWMSPLADPNRAQPRQIFKVPGRALTDTDFPSVSILSHASLRALSQKAGRPLAPERFRGNIWLDGLPPWEEFDWIGRNLRIGTVEFRVEERTTRCTATEASPVTGLRDTATLKLLEEGWNHRDFGIYASVVKAGTIATGDSVSVI